MLAELSERGRKMFAEWERIVERQGKEKIWRSVSFLKETGVVGVMKLISTRSIEN